MRYTVTVAAAVVVFAVAAQAGTVTFSNGAPNNSNGQYVNDKVIAEDFVLGLDVGLSGAGVYLGTVTADLSNFTGHVEYWIFDDSNGDPGSILTQGSGQHVTATNTGIDWLFGTSIWLVEFEFQSEFSATAGTNYWFGFQTPSPIGSVFWVATDHDTTDVWRYSQGNYRVGDPFSWRSDGSGKTENAFYLTSPTPVPLPSAAWLGFGLLAALGAARRIRRRR